MNVLFLDDSHERLKKFRSAVPFATLVETAEECIDALQRQEWDVVFLDHDLGDEVFVESDRSDCGMEVVRWIEENVPVIGEVIVHTMNTVAGKTMTRALLRSGYTAHYFMFNSTKYHNHIDDITYRRELMGD